MAGSSEKWQKGIGVALTIEEPFGWAKTVGGVAQTMYHGLERVRSRFILTMAANNLARLPRLLTA